ncbi:hypothetical protein L210DRAFT_3480021 [Boletus edulis BED1]|uniref:UvrD-like helicase C-terminal domain-containing protein n=1 Tax=Boletus edulis BED1 TaxID=1328754 RepID=A0AAD4GEN0_BOLED|nr:hypothetical protein L210DRAFT_3480021 [Boletus edulis BED1]
MRLPQSNSFRLKSVRRRQLPITPAYAITDYKSQGQTFPAVIVDIATPPTGGLNLFNLYVSLSRARSRDDDRLRALDETTKKWWDKVQN